MPRVRLIALPAALIAGLAVGVARAGPEDPAGGGAPASPRGELPAGIPVGIDGIVSSGEWEDAAMFPLAPGDAVLRAKQSRGTLLVGVVTARAWPVRGHFHVYASTGEGERETRVHLDFEPREHDRPHAMLWARTGAKPEAQVAGAVVARSSALETRASLEAGFALSVLGLHPKAPAPVRWIAVLSGPSFSATYPAGLDLRGPANAPPPDLASTARWAVATSWVELGGGGAYTEGDWKAWVEADREFARKGMEANRLARSFLDEAPDPKKEPSKHDKAIEETILAPLRAVGVKEPWTRADARSMAVGLWQQNRAEEALGLLEGSATLGGGGGPDPDDWLVEAKIAFDAERFERSAAAYARLAASLGERNGAPWASRAEQASSLAASLGEERARRAADAEKGDLPLALLRTSKGEILVRLLEDEAPNSVANFVYLVEEAKGDDGKPFYAGTLFHRVIPETFAQGGDPTSRTKGCDVAGGGGPAWRIEAEQPKRPFFRGALGWALDGNGRVGSQFFLVTGPLPRHQKLGMPLFGTVVSGMEAAERLDTCDALLDVRILRKREHPYAPRKRE